jgi:hypothetical protein
MKRITYNNMIKATKMIANKGYEWSEANELAIKCFSQMRTSRNGMSVEWFIDKINNHAQGEICQ